jgi:hypothetical protein
MSGVKKIGCSRGLKAVPARPSDKDTLVARNNFAKWKKEGDEKWITKPKINVIKYKYPVRTAQ